MLISFRQHWILFALLGLCISIYLAGLTPSFSSDDYVHLLNNRATSVSEAFSVFLEPFGREYRPMVRISLWLNHLMGDTALPFKITNLILHLGCVILLYILLAKLGVSKVANLLASSVFALHPIHTTSVHFILGRTDLVAAIFYLATLVSILWWNEKPTKGRYLTSVMLFVGTLTSKELAVTLPILMFAVLLTRSNQKNFSCAFNILRQLWLFIGLTTAYVLARIIQWQQMPDSVSVYTNYSPSHIADNYAQWLFALGYPFDLYIAQEWLINSPSIFLLICATIVCLLFTGAFLLWKEHFYKLYQSPLFWLGLVWLAVTLIPMSGGNPHRWYLYLPSAGFSIMFAAIWLALPTQNIIFRGFIALLLIVYAAETARQSHIWKKQHQYNEAFIQEFFDLNLHKEKEIYFANIPFGYKSAFMFTHNSLHEAILHRFGEAPVIRPISYLNIADSTSVTVKTSGHRISFSLRPNAYEFFLWRADLRRFNATESAVVYDAERTIEALANKKISSYSITLPESLLIPLYYFDGIKIQKFSLSP